MMYHRAHNRAAPKRPDAGTSKCKGHGLNRYPGFRAGVESAEAQPSPNKYHRAAGPQGRSEEPGKLQAFSKPKPAKPSASPYKQRADSYQFHSGSFNRQDPGALVPVRGFREPHRCQTGKTGRKANSAADRTGSASLATLLIAAHGASTPVSAGAAGQEMARGWAGWPWKPRMVRSPSPARALAAPVQQAAGFNEGPAPAPTRSTLDRSRAIPRGPAAMER